MFVVLSLLNTSNASCIIASLSKSNNADVASSKIKIGGLFKKILAIERRCF